MPISTLHKIKTYFQIYILKAFKLIYLLSMLKKVYKKMPTYTLSKQYRAEQEPNNPDLIYGEIPITSFLYLLALILGKTDCKIYDLGCGDAKLILAATLFFKNIQAVGIEKIPVLVHTATSVILALPLKMNNNPTNLQIKESDFLLTDFSDADVVYINSAVFKETTWRRLCEQFSQLKNGSYVISVIRKIEAQNFVLLYSGLHPASWGKARIYIYYKQPFSGS